MNARASVAIRATIQVCRYVTAAILTELVVEKKIDDSFYLFTKHPKHPS